MKKILYILLVAFASTITFSSCTEEEITPVNVRNGGGGISDPK